MDQKITQRPQWRRNQNVKRNIERNKLVLCHCGDPCARPTPISQRVWKRHNPGHNVNEAQPWNIEQILRDAEIKDRPLATPQVDGDRSFASTQMNDDHDHDIDTHTPSQEGFPTAGPHTPTYDFHSAYSEV